MWKVYLRQKAEGGKANEKLRELIAYKLGIAKSRVVILKGKTNRRKLIEVT